MNSLCKRLALMPALVAMNVNIAQAVAPAGKQVTAAIALQGGSDSMVKWSAPSTASYKIHVLVPKNGTETNALYRVYPKGKKAGSTRCDGTNAKYPCFEVIIDQTQHQNAWAQLVLNGDAETQWNFVKSKGYVTAVADNLGTTELLNVSALVRFEDTVRAIGKNYQGGIIFYVDSTGEHGLVAAPSDQSIGIRWYNALDLTTGAAGTVVGTGLANTTAIIGAQGAGSYAAMLCADLVIGVYSDWYLPSKDELNLMYQNIGPGAAAPLTNVGGFAGVTYWSSSESSRFNAWYQYFSSGDQVSSSKFIPTRHVRAVRAF